MTRPAVDVGTLRFTAGVLVLAVLLHQLGSGPFLDGIRAIDPWAVAAALVLTAGTTWACARRWTILAARHGEPLSLPAAYRAYYRSQLINAILPGGVMGDLHRGVRHGWRGVLWERCLGQLVQVALVGTLLLPGQWRWYGVIAFALVAATAGAVVTLSALSTTGHLLVFLVAAASVGVDLPLTALIPIGALVLLGASIPLNLAGWGPREGVAVWAFTAFGSTAATGLTVSVAFGVLSTLATLPGLFVLRPTVAEVRAPASRETAYATSRGAVS